MFIGVETDDTERTLDMKRIGPIAARLVANPTELVAAANQKRSTEFATDQRGEEEPASPSALSADAPAPSGSNEKVRGHAPAVSGHDGQAPRGKTFAQNRSRTLLRLVVSKGLRGAQRRQLRGSPAPAPRSPLLIVVGGHATSPW